MTAKEYTELSSQIISSLLFSTNIYQYLKSGYFDSLANLKPLLHLWSLGVEEQFYLFYPLIISRCNNFVKIRKILFFLFLTSFLINIVAVHKYQYLDFSFYLPFARFWELLAGALTFIFLDKLQQLPFKKTAVMVSLLSVILYSIKVDHKNLFPGMWALIPIFFSVVYIVVSKSPLNNFLSTRIPVFIGKCSYPIYLWHWLCLSFLRIIEDNVPMRSYTIVVILISILLSIFTYLLVEKPIQVRARNNPQFANKAFYTMVGLSIIILLLNVINYVSNGFAALRLTPDQIKLEQNLDWTLDPLACDTWKTCHIKNELSSGEIQIVLIGDSHADHFSYGLRNNLKKDKLQLGTFAISGCPPLRFDNLDFVIDKKFKSCLKKMDEIISQLGKMKKLKFAILASRFSYYENEIFSPETFKRGLENTVSTFRNNGVHVILIHEVPLFNNIKKCFHLRPYKISKIDPQFCQVPYIKTMKIQKDSRSVIEELKKQSLLETIDPLDFMCDQTSCTAKRGESVLFRDSDHLSMFGSQFLVERFYPQIRQIFKSN